MRIYISIISILILIACTNSHEEAVANDSSTSKKSYIDDVSVSNNSSKEALLSKIKSNIHYNKNLNTIFITDNEASININLIDYNSYLTLSINNNILNKDFKTNLDYIYSEDLDSAIDKIKIFSSDNSRLKALILPTTTEEFPNFNIITFNTDGLLKTYLIEIRDFSCSDINKISMSTDAILVKTDNDRTCDTYIMEEKIIGKNSTSLSSTDIFKKYSKRFYKYYEFDVNEDNIKDLIITRLNDTSDNLNVFQGDELYVYLANKNMQYNLSLDTINFTSDGGFFIGDIVPRSNHSGFILSTYFSSKGYPVRHYYYTFKNNSWYITNATTQGAMPDGEEYYCLDYNESRVDNYAYTLSASYPTDAELYKNCLLPSLRYVVKTGKAEILSEDFESRSPPNYYIKGELIEAFDQNEDWVKVSYKNGTKFGWIDKRELVPD